MLPAGSEVVFGLVALLGSVIPLLLVIYVVLLMRGMARSLEELNTRVHWMQTWMEHRDPPAG